ncbi:hypothetical protein DPMN_099054 [Dreissena polymorpha]|uniref:Uncharacterized protein n=1 Tax=Dreissena polymorpha TaxID=45954 RepID=A0A9D4LGF0_DREPO|nr:hypothetical protein DPMN_099054 [Dreissena polymorpha]
MTNAHRSAVLLLLVALLGYPDEQDGSVVLSYALRTDIASCLASDGTISRI